MKSFTFTQTNPSINWGIKHDLNDYPVSDVMINAGGGLVKTLPLSLMFVDPNNVIVHFSEPFSGEVRLIGRGTGAFDPDHPIDPGDGGGGDPGDGGGDPGDGGGDDGGGDDGGWVPTYGPPVPSLGRLVITDNKINWNRPGINATISPLEVAPFAGTTPQTVTLEFFDPTMYGYALRGSVDGHIGTGHVGQTLNYDQLDFVVTEGSVPFEYGDIGTFDLSYSIPSTNNLATLTNVLINTDNVVANTPEATELWTVTKTNATTFTVVGSVNGAQPNATVGVPYSNDFISFAPTNVNIGTVFKLQIFQTGSLPAPEEVIDPTGMFVSTASAYMSPSYSGVTRSRAGAGAFDNAIDQTVNGAPPMLTSPTREQRITIKMTSSNAYDVSGTVDGYLGSGVLNEPFDGEGRRVTLGQFVLVNSQIPLQAGDTLSWDLKYYGGGNRALPDQSSMGVDAHLQNGSINPSIVPYSRMGWSDWTILMTSNTQFTVYSAELGADHIATGNVDQQFTNEYISFLIPSQPNLNKGVFFNFGLQSGELPHN